MQLTITDGLLPGQETARYLLDGVPSPIALRELIRLRVRDEVARYNLRPGRLYTGLVQPLDSEVALNGFALAVPRRLDWEGQAGVAVEAFGRGGYLVFVDDRQVLDLDEELDLTELDVIRFLRLVPLVGG